MMSYTSDYPCPLAMMEELESVYSDFSFTSDETYNEPQESKLWQEKGSSTGFFKAKSTSLKNRIMEWPEELTSKFTGWGNFSSIQLLPELDIDTTHERSNTDC